MHRVIYALFAVIVSMSFDHTFMYAVAQPIQSSLIEKGLFKRGKRGKHGEHGERGRRGKKGATGATGAAGAGGNEAFGTVFSGAQTVASGNVVPFATQGVLDSVTYNGTDTYTIQTTGLYRVDYSFSATNSFTVEAFSDTGGGFTVIAGSASALTDGGFTTSIVYEANMQLNAGDRLQLQVTSGSMNIVFGTFSVTRLN